MKTRKQHYFLLEVLIAIALIAMCSIFLLRPHYAVFKSQENAITAVHLERYADILFSDIKVALDKGKISFNDVAENYNDDSQNVVSISTFEENAIEFLPLITISFKDEKGDLHFFEENKRKYALASIRISFTRKGQLGSTPEYERSYKLYLLPEGS